MAHTPKILAFAGSTRTESFNKKLIKVAAEAAKAAGAQVTLIDLRDLPMPLYDGDLEAGQGVPENGKKLKELIRTHDALLISAPEYNSSISGVLKNSIDWASRPPDNPFAGKIAAIMSASPGALGGLRGLVTVRAVLNNLNVLVLAGQVCVPKANEALGPDGKLKEPKQQSSVEALTKDLVTTVAKLKG